MKAEKRHQLQRNALADGVGRLVQGMRSGPTTRSTLVWVFVILAVVAVVVWQYTANATQIRYSALWTDVDMASHDPITGEDKLLHFGDDPDNRGTLPARTAKFEVARIALQAGQQGLRSRFEHTEAVKRLREAHTLYEKLLRECADSMVLAHEAMMGVAQAEESLVGVPINSENPSEVFTLETALKSYRRLADELKKHPDSFLAIAADKRIQEIEANRQEIEKFYTDLNEWSRRKEKFPAPDMGELPPLPTLPAPITGTPPSTPPELTAPKATPKTGVKSSTAQPAPATKTDNKPPSKNDSKVPAVNTNKKDSKSK